MQEFQILNCIECETFQVDIVKKVNKWTCKICNQKQSVMKNYGRSYSAKECRETVNLLNLKRQQKDEKILDQVKGFAENSNPDEAYETEQVNRYESMNRRQDFKGDSTNCQQSKWARFLKQDKDEEEESSSWKSIKENKSAKVNENLPSYLNESYERTSPSSSSFHSFPETKTEVSYKRKNPSTSWFDSDKSGALQKKSKVSEAEDDFELSQDDWDRLDGLV